MLRLVVRSGSASVSESVVLHFVRSEVKDGVSGKSALNQCSIGDWMEIRQGNGKAVASAGSRLEGEGASRAVKVALTPIDRE